MDDRAWARKIEERYGRGEKVPWAAVRKASDMLGRPLLRGGKHAQRPDAKDRQAGDVERSDNEMVPL